MIEVKEFGVKSPVGPYFMDPANAWGLYAEKVKVWVDEEGGLTFIVFLWLRWNLIGEYLGLRNK